MISGKTTSGFEFEIDDDVMDDMELLEGLTALDKGDMGPLSDVLIALFGKEQKKRLYDFLRGDRGRVKASLVMEAVAEVFSAISEANQKAKN